MAALRLFVYCGWAGPVEDAEAFLARLPQSDLSHRLPANADPALRRKARLDADWHGESVRCFSRLTHPALEFRPARTLGPQGLAGFLDACQRRPRDETWWLIFSGQDPQQIGAPLGPFCAALRRMGVRILYYAFDEASRTMPAFAGCAPHLDVLIHDEQPLAEAGRRLLRPDCRTIHRSWVANVLPFAAPFVAEPEPRILFLGSQLGLTPHRQRQIEYLQRRFGDRFTAIADHSVSVADRLSLSRFKVSVCPEGRKFGTPAMAGTHTDRPFWSGCLGLVPVSEDSVRGGRLEELARAGLIRRYPHGNLEALAAACDQALAATAEERRRIYDHFNQAETVGVVVADALASGAPTDR